MKKSIIYLSIALLSILGFAFLKIIEIDNPRNFTFYDYDEAVKDIELKRAKSEFLAIDPDYFLFIDTSFNRILKKIDPDPLRKRKVDLIFYCCSPMYVKEYESDYEDVREFFNEKNWNYMIKDLELDLDKIDNKVFVKDNRIAVFSETSPTGMAIYRASLKKHKIIIECVYSIEDNPAPLQL